MKQSFLTKTCTALLLAFIATAWCNQAWAIIINVRADDEPNIYAWNGNTTYNGAYPGNKITNTRTVGGKSWYYISIDATNVNIIISKGDISSQADETKTNDIQNITGTRYFTYNPGVAQNNRYGDVTDYYDFPNGVNDENDNYVYVVNVSGWNTIYAYVWNSSGNNNGTYPGPKMTKVGQNSKGFDVYKWSGTLPANPTGVKFSNGSGNDSGDQTWLNGTVWSNYNNSFTNDNSIVNGVLLDSDHFPDANMRTALTTITDVQENGIIETRNKTILDISNKGISDLTGIANFTNLEELDISNNNVSFGDITALTKLKKIVAHHNPGLQGFGKNSPNSSNPVLKISSSSVLEYVDVSNTHAYYLTQLNNFCGSTLETLIAANNPSFDYSTFTSCSVLKHLDLSNCGLTSTALNADHLNCPNLEYLDCSGNSRLISSGVYLTNLSKLKYFDMSGCNATPVNTVSNLANAKSTLEYLDLSNNQMTATGLDPALDGFTALKTFKFNTQPNWGNALSVSNCPELTYIDAKDNAKMTGLTINNCPKIETIDISNNALQTSLAITNCGLNAMPTGITGLGTTQALNTIDLTGNEFIAVPSIDSQTVTVLKMNNNKLTDISLPTGSNIEYLYAQDNEFAENYTLDGGSLTLKGLALSNKSTIAPMKTFTAQANNAIYDEWAINYSVTPPVTILMNNRTTDGSNTTLEAINLDGNTSLETVKVNGFKALTKLASDNDMTTTNGKGLYIKGNTAITDLDISNNRIEILGQDGSLSGLTNLETLNASHNKIMTLTNRSAISGSSNPRSAYGNGKYTYATCPNIEDLTGLKNLDLTYNLLSDSIHLWKNTSLERLDVSHNRIVTERTVGDILYYRDTKDGTFKQWHETDWKIQMDQYTHDTNDTIGLRMLDLWYNTNLKYLDISYTAIQNTAQNWSFVSNRVGPENLSKNDVFNGQVLGRNGVPKFVLINHCPALLEFHANYNGMKSLGVGHAPESGAYPVTGCPLLEHLEAIESRGQDPKIMQGEITLSVWNPNMKYYNISNSNFDKVNPYKHDEHGTSGQNLETLIIDGNYTCDNSDAWSLANAGMLDLSNNPNLVNLQANNCPNLVTVRANGLAKLNIISLDQDTTVTTVNNETVKTKLANLYVDHDAILDEVLGLETLSTLSVYHANDSHFTGAFVMPENAKSTLSDLRVGNESLSLAELRNNLTAVNLNGYTNIQHLETQNNPSITTLNVGGFTSKLEYIDFANNHVDNDGIQALSQLSALKYFSCTNDSKFDKEAGSGNWLTDLNIPLSTGIKEIYANNNDLHCIKGSFGNLERIEFAHNHINGIDLSAASSKLTANNIVDNDNGREITAEFSTFSKIVNNVVQEYKVYFFQLEKDAQGHGAPLLKDKTSTDTKNTPRVLYNDGFNLSEVNAWGGSDNNAALLTTSSSPAPSMLRGTTVKPEDLSPLDPNQVQGTIVVLNPTEEDNNGATGRATYTYNNGISDSEFYLDWSSDGQTVTGINGIAVIDGVSIAGNYGSLTVNGADGTVVDVYDMSGRQVAHETIGGGSVTIDGLTPGIYIVNGNKVVVK